ncbi:MAG TPA: hypothetical protein VLH19_04635 [Patescibacteria group bacterium]|nr:hypothetical protein [Patescibacteria group bacterium]
MRSQAFIASLGEIAAMTLSFVLLYLRLPPVLPLWYSLATPDQQLVNKFWLLSIPLSLLGILIFHIFLESTLKKFDPILRKILRVGTLLITTLGTIAFFRILWVTL